MHHSVNTNGKLNMLDRYSNNEFWLIDFDLNGHHFKILADVHPQLWGLHITILIFKISFARNISE